MMNFRIVLLILFTIGFMFGCGMLSGNKEAAPTPVPVTESVSKPAVGDMVVAKWKESSFYEGKVEETDGLKITVAWNDGSQMSILDDSDVFMLPIPAAKPKVEIGEFVLAKVGTASYWNGAEVISVEDEVYEVKTVENGNLSNVSGSKIIKVPPAVAANIRKRAAATVFLNAARQKKLIAPSGFEAKKGDKVLAEWAPNSWWAGKVTKAGGSKTTITWDDGSKPTEVDAGKVVPYPTEKDDKLPQPNQYLLIKPESGTEWEFARAVSLGDNGIEVKTAEGKTRTVKTGEFVLLN